MTVAELITMLQAQDQSATVLFRVGRDAMELDAAFVQSYSAIYNDDADIYIEHDDERHAPWLDVRPVVLIGEMPS